MEERKSNLSLETQNGIRVSLVLKRMKGRCYLPSSCQGQETVVKTRKKSDPTRNKHNSGTSNHTNFIYAWKFMSLGHSQSNINWGFLHIPPFQILYPNITIWYWFQYLTIFFEHLCFKFSNYLIKCLSSLFGIKKTTANDWIVVTKYAFKTLIFLLS